MCDTNYIYLLQEQQFINTKQNIYKIEIHTKPNFTSFNQYPKEYVLLFLIICNDCKFIEKKVIDIFKQNFKLRNDIGNKYFEGDYKIMIDIIYSTIKNEIINKDIEDNQYDDDEHNYKITTYEEWIKYNDISKIIITNKKGEGYLRFKGDLWRKLYDKERFDFDENEMEDLLRFIEKVQSTNIKMISPGNELVFGDELMNICYQYKNQLTDEIITWNAYNKLNKDETENYSLKVIDNDNYKCIFLNIEYDTDKIFKDTIKKCYVKNCDFYNLNYHEYVFPSSNKSSIEYFIFNSVNCTFTPVDELINNKILTEQYKGRRIVNVKNIVNIDIVDNILNSLITNEIKLQYKKLVYNLIVVQEEKQIIFYDYNDCLLTSWIKDLLYSISNNIYVKAHDYYNNKLEFKKFLKKHKPRCVIISGHEYSIKTQINDFCKLGFKNIIVCQNDKSNTMYNIVNFRKYLQDNKDLLIKCIKDEINYEHKEWQNAIQHDDSIFYSSDLLFTNFLKWCCVK